MPPPAPPAAGARLPDCGPTDAFPSPFSPLALAAPPSWRRTRRSGSSRSTLSSTRAWPRPRASSPRASPPRRRSWRSARRRWPPSRRAWRTRRRRCAARSGTGARRPTAAPPSRPPSTGSCGRGRTRWRRRTRRCAAASPSCRSRRRRWRRTRGSSRSARCGPRPRRRRLPPPTPRRGRCATRWRRSRRSCAR
jgi:hypothetical protein